MSHHSEARTLEAPQKIAFPLSGTFLAILLLLIGAGTFAWVLTSGDPERAWTAYLVAMFYFFSLGVFGTAWNAIQYLSKGVWSVPLRRVSEAMAAWLPFAALSGLLLGLGAHSLYHWTHHEAVQADELLRHKEPFLNMTAFYVFIAISFGIYFVFNLLMNRNSRRQDTTGDVKLTFANWKLGAVFLVLFALSFTLLSYLFLMSLEPHWFSTMYAVMTFTDMMQTGLAFMSLVAAWFILTGRLEGFVNENHLHDVAKMMYAFTGFWAYIYFCQFLLIWYGNIPEETLYFLSRSSNGWLPYMIALPLVKFVIPFVVLTSRHVKRHPVAVVVLSSLVLLAQFFHLFLLVAPAVGGHGGHGSHAHVPWVEFLVFLGFAGAFYLVFSASMKRHNPIPVKDPFLKQAVNHHT